MVTSHVGIRVKLAELGTVGLVVRGEIVPADGSDFKKAGVPIMVQLDERQIHAIDGRIGWVFAVDGMDIEPTGIFLVRSVTLLFSINSCTLNSRAGTSRLVALRWEAFNGTIRELGCLPEDPAFGYFAKFRPDSLRLQRKEVM
jgi:hypothetical protein